MGGKVSQLSADDLQMLKNGTPFDDQDIERVLGRYMDYDNTEKGTIGISVDEMMTMPELEMHPLLCRLLHSFTDRKTKRVYPQGFVKFFGILSSKTPVSIKKKVAFECFDLNSTGRLRHEELFQVYKLLLDFGVDDDQLMRITFSVIDSPCLQNPGEILFIDFVKIVADVDVLSKFTLDI